MCRYLKLLGLIKKANCFLLLPRLLHYNKTFPFKYGILHSSTIIAALPAGILRVNTICITCLIDNEQL